jgi:hypothetical protein
MEPVSHFGQKIEFVSEFLISLAIRHVAARRDVIVVNCDSVLQSTGNMACIALANEITVADVFDREPGQDGYAVVSLLTSRNQCVAERREVLRRDFLNRAFAFLQAKDIGSMLFQQFKHERFAKADRIDVPGG